MASLATISYGFNFQHGRIMLAIISWSPNDASIEIINLNDQICATCQTRTEVVEKPVAQQELLAVAGVDEGAQHASEVEGEPSRTNREQSRETLPKNLIAAFSRCRTSKAEVLETYSPDRRCTPASGME
uniref:Uncharacterized protein n=1 Tax=Oryza sativa subsp. japonica TaxID=39947 RepID=Q6ETB5_ORYSJ|nr:hypothetical protein [Oryza sativa Japonica Group]